MKKYLIIICSVFVILISLVISLFIPLIINVINEKVDITKALYMPAEITINNSIYSFTGEYVDKYEKVECLGYISNDKNSNDKNVLFFKNVSQSSIESFEIVLGKSDIIYIKNFVYKKAKPNYKQVHIMDTITEYNVVTYSFQNRNIIFENFNVNNYEIRDSKCLCDDKVINGEKVYNSGRSYYPQIINTQYFEPTFYNKERYSCQNKIYKNVSIFDSIIGDDEKYYYPVVEGVATFYGVNMLLTSSNIVYRDVSVGCFDDGKDSASFPINTIICNDDNVKVSDINISKEEYLKHEGSWATLTVENYYYYYMGKILNVQSFDELVRLYGYKDDKLNLKPGVYENTYVQSDLIEGDAGMSVAVSFNDCLLGAGVVVRNDSYWYYGYHTQYKVVVINSFLFEFMNSFISSK